MTTEERFRKIEDELLVTATLQHRLELTVTELTSDVRALKDGEFVLQAALKSLMAAVERFIQGKGGGGQRPEEG